MSKCFLSRIEAIANAITINRPPRSPLSISSSTLDPGARRATQQALMASRRDRLLLLPVGDWLNHAAAERSVVGWRRAARADGAERLRLYATRGVDNGSHVRMSYGRLGAAPLLLRCAATVP